MGTVSPGWAQSASLTVPTRQYDATTAPTTTEEASAGTAAFAAEKRAEQVPVSLRRTSTPRAEVEKESHSERLLGSVEARGPLATKGAAKGFGHFFEGGRAAKASELSADALRQGFTAPKATAGPLKFVDGNGVVRLTIKQGSSRPPGSSFAHAEFRNAAGQRVDALGNLVTRTSPGNHTPINFDLLP